MVHQSLRWLSEGSSAMWRGYDRGSEVAAVWPGELAGNHVSAWNWKLHTADKAGSVLGTGNDELDTYAAQSAANRAYFADAI